MDVSSIIRNAEEQAVSATDGYSMFALVLLILGLIGFGVMALMIRRQVNPEVVLPWTVVSGFVLMVGVGQVLINLMAADEERSERLNQAVAVAASKHYGMDVPPEAVSRAWAPHANEPVLFLSTKEGKEKSFGLNITDEGKLTVYEGGDPLPPAQ